MREKVLSTQEIDEMSWPMLKKVKSGTPPFDVKVYIMTWRKFHDLREEAKSINNPNAREQKMVAARSLIWRADEDELRKMLNVSKRLLAEAQKNPNADDAAKYWFGDSVSLEVVRNKLTTYSNFVNSIRKISFECSSDPDYADSYMAVNQTKHYPHSTTIRVTLGGGFRNARYQLGAIINSCLHEFSHICLRTEDVPKESAEKEKYYTAEKAISLAKTNPAKALVNAENWGYYLCDFQTVTDNIVKVTWGEPRRPS